MKAILFNIFGGITRCDEIAKGIVEALTQIEVKVPIVVRLLGTNQEEGRRHLGEAGFDDHRRHDERSRAEVRRGARGES